MIKASGLAAGESARLAGSQVLKHIRIVGGFLDGAEFDLSSGLNCLIGARGTGKTTVLELVRYALGAMPDPQTDPEAYRKVDSVIQANLGESGRVELEIQTTSGLDYTVSRAFNEAPLLLGADGSPADVSVRRGGVFWADIYSQNQIERLADEAISQLSLIDHFESTQIAQINSQIRVVETKLASSAQALTGVQEQVTTCADAVAGLPAVEEKLQALPPVTGPDAPAIAQAQQAKFLRQRETQALDGMWQYLQKYEGQLGSISGQLARQTQQQFVPDLVNGPNGAALGNLRDRLLQGAAEVDDLLQTARNRMTQMQDHLGDAGTELASVQAQQDLAYRELVEKSESTRDQAAARAGLERLQNDLVAKSRQRESLLAQQVELQQQRVGLLEELGELRERRYRVRTSVAQRISTALHPTIRVRMAESDHQEAYRAYLEEILRGVRMKQGVVAQKIVQKVLPRELVALVREKNVNSLKRRTGLGDEQAQKVMAALGDAETLYALEVIELPDRPIIELKDGAEYKGSTTLSTGQKCTTILPILLLDSDGPLLVDQPEDNLDNRFVCESVVESIRQVKQRRQLLFVTHNPNIPVLGDAQRVFVLESDGVRARKVAEGDVDECRDAIVNLLEGGEQAFRQRQERYAYP